MTQGKVIAVKPNSTKWDSDEVYARSIQVTNSNDLKPDTRYFVSVSESEDIVWFDAPKNAFKKGEKVEFEIGTNGIQIYEAVMVKKDTSLNPSLPKSLVSKVALLASLLLIASVIIEGKKNR